MFVKALSMTCFGKPCGNCHADVVVTVKASDVITVVAFILDDVMDVMVVEGSGLVVWSFSRHI